MAGDGEVVYRVGDRDEISFLDPGYEAFAAANAGPGVAPDAVLGRPLWDFITDRPTRHIYQEILAQARGGRTLRFPFRCDSPTHRRLMEMEVRRTPGGEVEFRVRTVRDETRPAQPLLDPAAPRTTDLLRMCGWCKKVDVDGSWAEVEDAVARLRLFERPALPAITHGICDPCLRAMMATIAGS